jgi:hypothetical protein
MKNEKKNLFTFSVHHHGTIRRSLYPFRFDAER